MCGVFYLIILLQPITFYYAKLIDTLEEERQFLGCVNPVVDSNDEDDDIFEPEKSFSGAFDIFVNRGM